MPFPTTDYNPKPLHQEVAEMIEEKPVQKIESVRDFSNIDDLISELNTPKEVISNAGTASPGETVAETVNSFPGFEPERPTITKDEASRTGRTAAKTTDTAISFGLSLYAKEKDNIGKYRATEEEIKDLSEAYAEISETYNFKMSPIPNLLMVLLAIYGPNFMNAKEDRWKNEFKQRQEDQEKKQDEMQSKLDELNKRLLELTKDAA